MLTKTEKRLYGYSINLQVFPSEGPEEELPDHLQSSFFLVLYMNKCNWKMQSATWILTFCFLYHPYWTVFRTSMRNMRIKLPSLHAVSLTISLLCNNFKIKSKYTIHWFKEVTLKLNSKPVFYSMTFEKLDLRNSNRI